MRCLLIIILCIIVFSGCQNHYETSSLLSEVNMDLYNSNTTNDVSDGWKTGHVYYVEKTEKNCVSVEVPVIGLSTQIEDLLQKEVFFELERILPIEELDLKKCKDKNSKIDDKINTDEYSDYFLNITSKIAFWNEETISVIFEGICNYKQAAHPNHIFFTVNIDLNEIKRVYLSDYYPIDSKLFNDFLINVDEKLSSFGIFDEETFISGLLNERESDFCSYFTDAHIGISYPLNFALGNHIEAEVKAQEKTGDGSVS